MTAAEVLHHLETYGWVFCEGDRVRRRPDTPYQFEVGVRVANSYDTRDSIDLRLAEAYWASESFADYLLSLVPA